MNILKKINDYNNKKIIEINKKLNIKKNYNINFDKDKKQNIIISAEGKKILVGKYIFLGIYQPDNQLWIWASSIPGVNQKNIKLINDIKNKNYLFENDDDPNILFIYQLLTNDVIQLPYVKKFELINKTLNYLSDSIIIFNPVNQIGNTQFIGLQNIIEEYI
jgi:hypothetical protein